MSIPADKFQATDKPAERISWFAKLKRLSPMPRLSARFHISIGLSSLVGSVALLAVFAGLVPDLQVQKQQSRTRLAESMTAMGSALLRNGETAGLRFSLEFIVSQNPDIFAITLKRDSGGEFQFMSDAARSLDSQGQRPLTDDITVPVMQRSRVWGELLFEFVSDRNQSRIQQYKSSTWVVIGFMTMLCFPLFYFFLGKVLKELNPSSAVPSRVRSALDTIAEALLVLDASGDIVLANQAFMQLTGKSIEQLLGQSAKEQPWQNKDSFVWEDALYRAEISRHEKIGFTNLDGKLRTFIVNCSPVITADDEVGGVLISMDDVTRLEEQEVLLRESMQIAEEASHAKSTFLSNMSHEIRTPMTAILGFTEVMRRNRSQTEAERQDYLNTIANSGQHLLELINDVLDLSKVESGNMDIEPLPCNPAEIANEVILVLRSKADEKGIDLQLQIDTPLPGIIITDPSRLRQIITNLVGNAIKFTGEGGVTISLKSTPTGQGDKALFSIDVIDSGIGMTADQQSRVFDAFAQADNSIARRYGGTGLGLSISRQLTEAMKGELKVASVEGQGSTFSVVLPYESDARQGVGQMVEPELIWQSLTTSHAHEQLIWEIDTARILVVDDGAENRQLLSIVLSDMGLEVILAENGQEGVDILFGDDSDDIALVLMDIQMPVLDGYAAVALMRKRGATLPVVALTANAMKGFEAKVLAAGFSHYMAKPIDIDKLGALLAELVGGSHRAADKSNDNKPSPVPTLVESEASTAMATSTVVHGEQRAVLISDLAVTDARFIPIVEDFRLRLGERLVELHEALDVANWKLLSEIGHWLKGSSGSVGLMPLVAPGLSLETAALQKDKQLCAAAIAQIKTLQKTIVADPASRVSSEAMASSATSGELIDAQDSQGPVFSMLPVHVPEFYEVVGLFITRLAGQMQLFADSVDTGDVESINEVLHWLRGSGGNVGFAGYKSLCHHIEEGSQHTSADLAQKLESIREYNTRVTKGWALTDVPDNSNNSPS